MKKTIIAIALLAGASWVAAGNLATGGKTTVGGTGTVACGMVASTETATVQLSKDVEGDVACTTNSAGVATAHPQGKQKIYSVSSNGGKLSETDGASSGTGAAATAAMNAS